MRFDELERRYEEAQAAPGPGPRRRRRWRPGARRGLGRKGAITAPDAADPANLPKEGAPRFWASCYPNRRAQGRGRLG